MSTIDMENIEEERIIEMSWEGRAPFEAIRLLIW